MKCGIQVASAKGAVDFVAECVALTEGDCKKTLENLKQHPLRGYYVSRYSWASGGYHLRIEKHQEKIVHNLQTAAKIITKTAVANARQRFEAERMLRRAITPRNKRAFVVMF